MQVAVPRVAAWAPGLEDEAAWRAWASAPVAIRGDGAPEARFLPPLLRRRCDALARMMLHVAHECCPAELRSSVACVFASRHGSFATTVALLEDLARDAALSPARFSHSVHNAPAGLFSIWAENRAASLSLAASDATFAHGLLEAVCAVQRGRGSPVLFVHADEALPEAVRPLADRDEGAYALALLLGDPGSGPALGLSHAPEAVALDAAAVAAPDAAAPRSGGLEFLRWWLCEELELRLPYAGGAYALRRAEARA